VVWEKGVSVDPFRKRQSGAHSIPKEILKMKKIQVVRAAAVALAAVVLISGMAFWAILGFERLLVMTQEAQTLGERVVPLATFAAAVWGAWKAYRGWEAAEATKHAAEELARKLATPVTIKLVTKDGRELALPYRPLRSQLSRAEVAGVLGMFQPPAQGGRLRQFNLPQLSEVFTSGKFDTILVGDTDVLEIPAPDEEYLVVAEELAARASRLAK